MSTPIIEVTWDALLNTPLFEVTIKGILATLAFLTALTLGGGVSWVIFRIFLSTEPDDSLNGTPKKKGETNAKLADEKPLGRPFEEVKTEKNDVPKKHHDEDRAHRDDKLGLCNLGLLCPYCCQGRKSQEGNHGSRGQNGNPEQTPNVHAENIAGVKHGNGPCSSPHPTPNDEDQGYAIFGQGVDLK